MWRYTTARTRPSTLRCRFCQTKPSTVDFYRAKVGRCMLKPVFVCNFGILRASLWYLTQCPRVIRFHLTTCYSVRCACFLRWSVKYDKLISNFAFIFNVRRQSKVSQNPQRGSRTSSRTTSSSTLEPRCTNLSALMSVWRCRLTSGHTRIDPWTAAFGFSA